MEKIVELTESDLGAVAGGDDEEKRRAMAAEIRREIADGSWNQVAGVVAQKTDG